MYVMKFYDELLSSDLEISKFQWEPGLPVYLKEPGDSDPPLRAA